MKNYWLANKLRRKLCEIQPITFKPWYEITASISESATAAAT